MYEGSTSTFVQWEYVSVDFILGMIKISRCVSCWWVENCKLVIWRAISFGFTIKTDNKEQCNACATNLLGINGKTCLYDEWRHLSATI